MICIAPADGDFDRHRPAPSAHGPPVYGGRMIQQELKAFAEAPISTPAMNVELIRNIAAAKGPDGELEVRSGLTLTFNKANNGTIERARGMQEHVQAELAGAQRHIDEASQVVAKTEPYRDTLGTDRPLTRFDMIESGILIVTITILLGVAVNNTAQFTMASGLPVFENPVRCYLFALTPIGITFVLKIIREIAPGERSRQAYTFGLVAAALALAVSWTALFARRFPQLSQSSADLLRSVLSENTGSSEAEPVLFVAVSILADCFLAAVLWIRIRCIAEAHAPTVRTPNPARKEAQKELDVWKSQHCQLKDLEGHLQSKAKAIDDARRLYVEEGLAYFLRLIQSDEAHRRLFPP